jgi:uncharacterized protein (TIGR00725 family)
VDGEVSSSHLNLSGLLDVLAWHIFGGMRRVIIGIMGPGEDALPSDLILAKELGRLVAIKGWVLLTGGRMVGVMHEAAMGAKEAGGLTVGILPFAGYDAKAVSPAIDIPILTGMGEARNVINVLTSRVIIVCGMSSGTASEVALALRVRRPVVLVGAEPGTAAFFSSLDRPITEAKDAKDAINIVEKLLLEG